MLYSYGLYGCNNRPYNDYYLNCCYGSVFSKNFKKYERKDVDNIDLVYQLWENVKAELKKNTSETVYSVWFHELALDNFDGESVVLTHHFVHRGVLHVAVWEQGGGVEGGAEVVTHGR